MRDLSKDVCAAWLKQLREAREAGYSDIYEAHRLVVEIEQFGRLVKGIGGASLHHTQEPVRCFIRCHAPGAEKGADFCLEGLQRRIRDRRNDYAHTGSAARRLGTDAAKLCICIEEALMEKMVTKGEKPLKARDLMTSPVTVASKETTVGTLRRLMLLNEFSRIPYSPGDEKWIWLTAGALAKYYSPLTNKSDREKKSILTVEEALQCKLGEKLGCETACYVKPDDCLSGRIGETLLVVSGEEAVGVVTEFDWL